MEPEKIACPLCDMDASGWADLNKDEHYSCPRCGKFIVTWQLVLNIEVPKELRPYLSAATRQASEEGNERTLTASNWREIADTQRTITIPAKLERILRVIGQKAGTPGGVCPIDIHQDFPLFSAVTMTELVEYLDYLRTQNLLRTPANFDLSISKLSPASVTGDYVLTIEGWQKIAPMPTPGGERDRCFVAMWFKPDLDAVYESGFAKAVEQCGFRPYRVKDDPTNKSVIDQILSEIRRAHFVVADYTGQRQSVYYEAGFAHGLGREVISCCQEGSTDKLAFDTRHLGHIVWKDAADLRVKLADSIRANIIPRR